MMKHASTGVALSHKKQRLITSGAECVKAFNPLVKPCPFKWQRVKGGVCNEWWNMMTGEVSHRSSASFRPQ